jgi:hypothetical protein
MMKYLERFEDLIAEKNFNEAATITGRTVDYIDNLIMKIERGTAAYPAQSNKIDKGLSMFYYQSPDVGDEFKQWLIQTLTSSYHGDLKTRIEKLGKQLLTKDSHTTREEIISAIQSASGYDLLRKGAVLGVSLPPSDHTAKMTKRMKDTENSLIGFYEFMVASGDDDQEFSMDMLLDALDETRASLDGLTRSAGGGGRQSDRDRQEILEAAIADVENNDFKGAAKNLRAVARNINNIHRPHPKDVPAIRDALRKINTILSMVDMQRYDRDQIIKNRFRKVRKSAESFLTLFESKEGAHILSESRWLKLAGISTT